MSIAYQSLAACFVNERISMFVVIKLKSVFAEQDFSPFLEEACTVWIVTEV